MQKIPVIPDVSMFQIWPSEIVQARQPSCPSAHRKHLPNISLRKPKPGNDIRNFLTHNIKFINKHHQRTNIVYTNAIIRELM